MASSSSLLLSKRLLTSSSASLSSLTMMTTRNTTTTRPSSSLLLNFHVIGDVFVDILCYLENDWPERGGDANLMKPITTMAGGSALNTTTHLNSLLLVGSTTSPSDTTTSDTTTNNNNATTTTVTLHSSYNPNDQYGKMIIEHTQKYKFPIINCLKIHGDDNNNDDDDDDKHKVTTTAKPKEESNKTTTQKRTSIPPPSTGHCICIVAKGDRSFMTHNGAMSLFNAKSIDMKQIISIPSPMIQYQSQQQIQQQQHNVHVHIAGFYNIEGFWNGQLEEQLQKIRNERQTKNNAAKTSGTTTTTTTISMVPQFDSTDKWDGGIDDIIPLLDFIIMNDVEATNIMNCSRLRRKRHNGNQTTSTTSNDDDDDDDDDNIHQQWANYFVTISETTTYIITLGKDGAIAIRGGKVIAQRSTVKVDNPIDPTGAGDSFAAGFLHGIWMWRKQQQEEEDEDKDNKESTKVDFTTSATGTSTLFWSNEAIEYGLRWGCAVGTASVMISGASEPAKMVDIESYM